jgi:hypothetical protein
MEFGLPTDRLHKTETIGGAMMFFLCISFTGWWWSSSNDKWLNLEGELGQLEVDFAQATEDRYDWKTLLANNEKLKVDIDLKRKFGPLKPMTEAEKQALRDGFTAVADEPQKSVVVAKYAIAHHETMRERLVALPGVPLMEEQLAANETKVKVFEGRHKDIEELRKSNSKLAITIGNTTARLNRCKRDTWVGTIAGAVGGVLGICLTAFGYRRWRNDEKASVP